MVVEKRTLVKCKYQDMFIWNYRYIIDRGYLEKCVVKLTLV